MPIFARRLVSMTGYLFTPATLRSRAGRSLGTRRPATHFTFACGPRRLPPEYRHFIPAAVGERQSAQNIRKAIITIVFNRYFAYLYD